MGKMTAEESNRMVKATWLVETAIRSAGSPEVALRTMSAATAQGWRGLAAWAGVKLPSLHTREVVLCMLQARLDYQADAPVLWAEER